MKRISYYESERMCEATFLSGGCWWHLYTPGNLTSLLFADDDDYRFAMNLTARCIAEFPALKVVAFEIMSNHLHIVLCGDKNIINEFFTLYRKRLKRYLSKKVQGRLSNQFQMSLKQINDLKALREAIVYVNRNGYVVNPSHTPFSYPWGTGRYYFNDVPITKRLSDVPDIGLRKMFRSRNPHLPVGFRIINGHIAPTEYCAIKLGMAMFRNAHQYFYMVSKNIEAYEKLATELDDGEFLTDSELFPLVVRIVKSSYNTDSLRNLTQSQKLDLARKLRSEYRSSNGQIRRILGLSQYEVDSLFPLSASNDSI